MMASGKVIHQASLVSSVRYGGEERSAYDLLPTMNGLR